MEWLKADFHLHTQDDHCDILFYSAYELIDRCADLGYSIIAIANHRIFTYEEAWQDYALERNMLVIPAVEACIGRAHVLILNANKDANNIHSFEDLEDYKSSHDVFIVAPHPFSFDPICLRDKLYDYAHLFDGVEIHNFHTKHYNPNKKAEAFARKYGKTLVGNSDGHYLRHIGKTYTEIKADLTLSSVMAALREGEVRVVTEPLGFLEAFNLHFLLRLGGCRRVLRRMFPGVFFKDHPDIRDVKSDKKNQAILNSVAKTTNSSN